MSNPTIELDWGGLRDRAVELDKIAREAWRASINAWAECARLELIRQAEQDPNIIGLSFEVEYAYNDEGGYYKSASIYPIMRDGTEEADPYEFSDEMNTYGAEVLSVLCGLDPDNEDDGQVTVAEAKEMTFR